MSLIAVAFLIVVEPFDLEASRLEERPDVLLAVVALSGIVGWWAGPTATRTGWWRAAVVGGLAGIAWGWLGIFMSLVASLVDNLVRGVAEPFGTAGPIAWWYVLVLGSVYVAAIGGPLGVIWGLVTRALAPAGGFPVASSGHTAPVILALGLVASLVGIAQAGRTMPADARCLDLAGERSTDGAFSPSGDRLAVISIPDPNEEGTVRLFAWPEGRLEASWTAWVDHDVVVDPAGRAYWSAWTPQEPWTVGIMTAAPGSAPSWFAVGEQTPLWQLTWTRESLRGMTSDVTHRMASIPLTGVGAGMVRIDAFREPLGAFWATADGRTILYGEERSSLQVTVAEEGQAARHVPVSGDPRSIALSADGREIVVASWDGGTRRIDIETGRSEPVLSGSQAWISVSPSGDLAWGSAEERGAGAACVTRLEP
jgi:hypothetical protein